MNRWTLLCLLALAACDRSDDDKAVPAGQGLLLPAAVAGEDFKVLASAGPPVTLKGDKSSDPGGGPATYSWEQTAGTPVTLSSATAANPTFAAPAFDAVTPANNTLIFKLTVTGAQGSDSDTVAITVKKLIVSAPDKWFTGYGNADSITAAAQGASGTYTYQWTGMEPWLIVTGGPATATLSFTTPLLLDFQNFPDRAEVAPIERTTQGRLQLKVTAVDSIDATATDSDFVNLSVGPFADIVAHENVAKGEPVFLNGGETNPAAITSWAWSGTKPNGLGISFFKPDKTPWSAGTPVDRFVYFVPDLEGPYEIMVEQNPGNITKTILVNCGKYVGVGGLTGKPPDPFKGECASCHAGQLSWLSDFATPWAQTGHASMFQRLLDPAHPSQAKGLWIDAFNFGSNYSIDSRTLGFSRGTAGGHGGWAEQATAEGFVFQGSTWEELVRKHPKTAGVSNVQCESCHGPGSEHAGDSTAIRKSYDVAVCGRCHSRKQDLWEAGAHGKPPITSPSGNASCNNCHTAQGYVVEMRAQEGADPHTALFALSNVNRPVIPYEDRRGTTCQACHEPHKKTANRPATAVDPQLRAYGNVLFRNGAVAAAGEAATCYTCHQSRTDARANSNDMNIRRAPHDSTAAEMLSATNAVLFDGWTYDSSPHGIASRFVTPSKGENRQCLACHVDVQPAKGELGYGALGGHTFNVKQGDGGTLAGSGDPAYTGAATDTANKRFTVATGKSFLKRVFPGDTLTFDATTTVEVEGVDGARQLALKTAPPAGFSAWSLTSVAKYNVASCAQCHPPLVPGTPFTYGARGNYDGVNGVQSVQQEIQGLLAALKGAIEAKLADAQYVGQTVELLPSSGRIKYKILSGPLTGKSYTFSGPSVVTSEVPGTAFLWANLTAAQQATWQTLYGAAYNYQFVINDKSGGIHNTGYAVNLLQSGYQAVTGTSIGVPFAPY